MQIALRYALMQVPGALLVAGLLYLLVRVGWIGPTVALLVLAVWVLKDAVLYPLYRPALEQGVPTGAEALIGSQAVARTEIDPYGRVRVRGELWRARARDRQRVALGETVDVVGAEGLTLIVMPVRMPGDCHQKASE